MHSVIQPYLEGVFYTIGLHGQLLYFDKKHLILENVCTIKEPDWEVTSYYWLGKC